MGETTAKLYFERILLFAQSYLARHTVSRGRPETNVFVSHNFNLVVFISLMCGVGFEEAFDMAGHCKVASVTRLYENEDGTWAIDPSLAGSLDHMERGNWEVATKKPPKDHEFVKAVMGWVLKRPDSVAAHVGKWVQGGSLPSRTTGATGEGQQRPSQATNQHQQALYDDIRTIAQTSNDGRLAPMIRQ